MPLPMYWQQESFNMSINFLQLKSSFVELLTNRVLLCAMATWIVAQILKIFTSSKYRHTLRPGHVLVRSGGMPSSHSAVVCATCFSCGILYGYNSGLFAIAAVLAVVVMRDAAGIRRQAGKQAEVLNEMSARLNKNRKAVKQVTLSELLGHTPLQVVFGALLGVAMAFVCQHWLFPKIFPVS